MMHYLHVYGSLYLKVNYSDRKPEIKLVGRLVDNKFLVAERNRRTLKTRMRYEVVFLTHKARL